jgi:hypothetical protein
MIEIEISRYTHNMMSWLRQSEIEHTYFSGKNIIAFISDEDASAFMLVFGGKRGHFVEEMQQGFAEAAKRERFERSRIR